MTYFFLIFWACSEQKNTDKEIVQPVRTVKFAKFDISAKCVMDREGFQKMFVQYQNQIQTCFEKTSEKTLDIKAKITNGAVDPIPPTTSPCLKGVVEKWKFDTSCSSELNIQIRPLK